MHNSIQAVPNNLISQSKLFLLPKIINLKQRDWNPSSGCGEFLVFSRARS